MRRRTPLRFDDRGFTLIETFVMLVILVIVIASFGAVYVNAQGAQVRAARSDGAGALIEQEYAKSASVDYGDLGYYTGDAGFTAGPVTLPIWPTANSGIVDNPDTCTGTCPAKITETQVNLGSSRPAGTSPFAPRTQTATIKGVTYRLDTWVTSTTDGSKRITVQGVTPSTASTCSTATSCVVQTWERGPSSADQAPDGTTSVSPCTSGTAAICQVYIRSGRVLSGDKMRSSVDTAVPEQISDVPLYVRTTLAATAVTATWQSKASDGSLLPAVTVNTFTKVDGDAHQWKAVVPADTGVGAIKGWIRPGSATVTFTATIGSNVTATTVGHWSYTNTTPVTVTSVSTAKCNGSTGATRVQVTGLSMGFGTQSDAGKDQVSFEFPVVQGGVGKSVTVPGVLDVASVSPQYTYQSGALVSGWVNAQFTAAVPASDLCSGGVDTPSPYVTVLVKRASDNTVTAKTLQLVQPF